MGQYTREGPVEAMRNICPLFSGDYLIINYLILCHIGFLNANDLNLLSRKN